MNFMFNEESLHKYIITIESLLDAKSAGESHDIVVNNTEEFEEIQSTLLYLKRAVRKYGGNIAIVGVRQEKV